MWQMFFSSGVFFFEKVMVSHDEIEQLDKTSSWARVTKHNKLEN